MIAFDEMIEALKKNHDRKAATLNIIYKFVATFYTGFFIGIGIGVGMAIAS